MNNWTSLLPAERPALVGVYSSQQKGRYTKLFQDHCARIFRASNKPTSGVGKTCQVLIRLSEDYRRGKAFGRTQDDQLSIEQRMVSDRLAMVALGIANRLLSIEKLKSRNQ